MLESMAQRLAASEIVQAFEQGRVLHFNGGQAAMLSSSGRYFLTADVTSGRTSSVEIESDASTREYVESMRRTVAVMDERSPEQVARDSRTAVELRTSWGLGVGTQVRSLPLSAVASEVVLAIAEGRVLHFNGGQAATVSQDGQELVVLNVVDCTREVTRLIDDVAALDYVSRSVRGPADMDLARKLAAGWGVPEPVLPEPAVAVSIGQRSARSRDALGAALPK